MFDRTGQPVYIIGMQKIIMKSTGLAWKIITKSAVLILAAF